MTIYSLFMGQNCCEFALLSSEYIIQIRTIAGISVLVRGMPASSSMSLDIATTLHANYVADRMTLSPSTGKPSSTVVTSLAERFVDGKSLEAAYIFQTGGFYYLFASWDYCCQGISSTYNIRVTRSTSCVT